MSVVLAPLVRRQRATPEFMVVFRLAARRFRLIVWTAIALLLATGPALLHQRGLSLFDPGAWPQVFRVKLSLVAALILLTAAHDLLLGPQMRSIGAIPEPARSPWQQILTRTAAWLPRLSLVLALAVVWAAAVLARS